MRRDSETRVVGIGDDIGHRPVVPDAARQDKRHIVANAFVHDAAFENALFDRRLDAPQAADGVDGPEMVLVSLLGG